MAQIEVTPRKLVLTEGSTTLTLDKDLGRQRCSKKCCCGTKSRSSSRFPALECGAEALFTKPIDFGVLRSEINTRVEQAA